MKQKEIVAVTRSAGRLIFEPQQDESALFERVAKQVVGVKFTNPSWEALILPRSEGEKLLEYIFLYIEGITLEQGSASVT